MAGTTPSSPRWIDRDSDVPDVVIDAPEESSGDGEAGSDIPPQDEGSGVPQTVVIGGISEIAAEAPVAPVEPAPATTITVTNSMGGVLYLRGPKIGEVRLAAGESFTAPTSLMPLGKIRKLINEGKLRSSMALDNGD